VAINDWSVRVVVGTFPFFPRPLDPSKPYDALEQVNYRKETFKMIVDLHLKLLGEIYSKYGGEVPCKDAEEVKLIQGYIRELREAISASLELEKRLEQLLGLE
jgi:hypothetical protein